jgi:putative hydrolase of the HAD superfamily
MPLVNETCIMLDVDGVLIRGRPEDGKPWSIDIERDLGVDADRLRDLFFARHWNDIVTGTNGLREILGKCLPGIHPTLSVDEFIDYWFNKDALIDTALLAEVTTLRSSGMRIFLATNQEHLRARYLMQSLGLAAHFDGIVYSADIGARKPEPAFFEAALARSGSAAGQTLLVDDTLANVETAKAMGWNGYHWANEASLIRLLDAGS